MKKVNIVFVPAFMCSAFEAFNVNLDSFTSLIEQFEDGSISWQELSNEQKSGLHKISKRDLFTFADLNSYMYDAVLKTDMSDGVSESIWRSNREFDYRFFDEYTDYLKAMESFDNPSVRFEDSFEIEFKNNFFLVYVKDGFSNIINNKENRKILLEELNKKIYTYLCEDIAKNSNINFLMLKS